MLVVPPCSVIHSKGPAIGPDGASCFTPRRIVWGCRQYRVVKKGGIPRRVATLSVTDLLQRPMIAV